MAATEPGSVGRSIVVGIDSSPGAMNALHWAIRMAAVTAVHGGRATWRGGPLDRTTDGPRDVERLVAPIRAAGVLLEIVACRSPNGTDGFIDIVDERPGALVVIGATEVSDALGLRSGGLSLSLLHRRADRPIVMVPARSH